jgi:Zn-dependent protease
MNFGLLVLYLAFFFLFFKIVTYVIVVRRLLGLRFKKGDCRLCEKAEVPSHVKTLLEANSDGLAKLGFCFSHYQMIDEPLASAHSKRWNAIYSDTSKHCYADVSVSPMPDQNSPIKVEFVSHFSDGQKLLTVNGIVHDIIGNVPDTLLIDPYAESLEKQFLVHAGELAKLRLKKAAIALEPSEYTASEKKTADEYVNGLETEGFIKPTDDGYRQLCLLPALWQAFKSMKGVYKVKHLRGKQQKHANNKGTPVVEVPIDVEVENFFRTRQLIEAKKMGLAGKLSIFVISVIIFMLFFGISFSPEIVPILFGALLLHELGHVLGMRLFKYKDVQVLFLPFGAATIGSDKQASTLERVAVYLLGPAPGILIGTLCMVFYEMYPLSALKEAGIFLLILNYLNLLPLLPLDGGRVFEATLFSKVHFLKSAFLILSVAALAIVGISLRDYILIAFSVFLGLSIRPQMLQNLGLSRLKKKVKSEQLERRDEVIVPAIFGILKGKPFSKLAFTSKFTTAKYMLDNSMAEQPTVWVTVLAMFLYLTVWLLPLCIIIPAAFLNAIMR